MSADKNNSAGRLFGGVVAPLALVAYALFVAVTGQALLRGRYGGRLVLAGIDAGLFVLCLLALAVALRCFQPRGTAERLEGLSKMIAALALGVFIATLGALVVRQLLNFI